MDDLAKEVHMETMNRRHRAEHDKVLLLKELESLFTTSGLPLKRSSKSLTLETPQQRIFCITVMAWKPTRPSGRDIIAANVDIRRHMGWARVPPFPHVAHYFRDSSLFRLPPRFGDIVWYIDIAFWDDADSVCCCSRSLSIF